MRCCKDHGGKGNGRRLVFVRTGGRAGSPSIGGKRPAWQSRRGRVVPQGKHDPADRLRDSEAA
jgi:hypothetical protein